MEAYGCTSPYHHACRTGCRWRALGCADSATFARCALPTNDTFGSTSMRIRATGNAHFRRTGPAITAEFPQLDVLFVGAGTTGTLMGCARYLREWHRPVHVVAVDSVGSVTFGVQSARRMIPGLGTAVRPDQLDESFVDEVMIVEEADTIRTCYQLAKHGFLFGGSTGTVVSAAVNWLNSTTQKRSPRWPSPPTSGNVMSTRSTTTNGCRKVSVRSCLKACQTKVDKVPNLVDAVC